MEMWDVQTIMNSCWPGAAAADGAGAAAVCTAVKRGRCITVSAAPLCEGYSTPSLCVCAQQCSKEGCHIVLEIEYVWRLLSALLQYLTSAEILISCMGSLCNT